MKLKTLKELGNGDKWVGKVQLRKEAIKQIKALSLEINEFGAFMLQDNCNYEEGKFKATKNFGKIDFIKKFFNITEEDLQ